MNRREHWDQAYQAKGPQGVGWFERHPAVSLELISQSGIDKAAGVIDVGGGASTLVDHLLATGIRIWPCWTFHRWGWPRRGRGSASARRTSSGSNRT
jgi:hypothetical protein